MPSMGSESVSERHWAGRQTLFGSYGLNTHIVASCEPLSVGEIAHCNGSAKLTFVGLRKRTDYQVPSRFCSCAETIPLRSARGTISNRWTHLALPTRNAAC